MLDKIEVGSKWKSNDGSGTVTVDAVEKTLIAYHWFDGTKGATTILDFRTAFEPLPSPESPVDDVIFETVDQKHAYKIQGGQMYFCPLADGNFELCGRGLQQVAAAFTDLYARLNPPLPPLPDGEWERVEVIGTGDIRGDESELVLSGKNWYCVDGDFYAGMAVGRGWVMRKRPANATPIKERIWVMANKGDREVFESLWAVVEGKMVDGGERN